MSRSPAGLLLAFALLLGADRLLAQQPSLGASQDLTAWDFRGQIGRRVTYVCPASSDWSAILWGTGVYTHDSSICRAAVHAGVLKDGLAGVVVLVMGSGANSYQGSLQNGVTSKDYGPWDSSFSFDANGAPGQIDWTTTAVLLPAGFTEPINVVCPAGGNATARIWGTDTYTDDSSVCVAAVHAGVISLAAGGKVTVRPSPGQPTYLGSERAGIVSESYGPWPRSFRLTDVPIPTIATRAAAPALAVGPKPLVSNLSRTIALSGFTAAGTSVTVAPRTLVLAGFTAVGTAVTVAPRTITLAGFTATGTSVTVAPRTIALAGFTAVGTAVAVAPRTITLDGWTGLGSGN